MTKLNDAQIATYAWNAGLQAGNGDDHSPMVLAIAVALAESGGDTDAEGGGAYGLWQIQQSAHPEYSVDQLKDPATNAAAMVKISKNGTDWGPWSAYNNGSYKQFIQKGFNAYYVVKGQPRNSPVIGDIQAGNRGDGLPAKSAGEAGGGTAIWARIAVGIAGAVVLFVALARITGTDKAAVGVAKTAVKVAAKAAVV